MGIFSSGNTEGPGLTWEALRNDGARQAYKFTFRSKVPGGWLVGASYTTEGIGLTFLPDPNHEWDGNSLD